MPGSILLALFWLVGITSPSATAPHEPAPLTFEDRVRAQEAIERVYYAHRLGATRTFEEAIPEALLQSKVRAYLKQTVALEQIWHTPLGAVDLSAEMERMVRDTRDPETLAELFAALGGDPVVIQECLVRSLLVERLAHAAYAADASLHAGARLEAAGLHERLAGGELSLTEAEPHRTVLERPGDSSGSSAAAATPGVLGDVAEQSDGFEMTAVLEHRPTTTLVASWFVPKVSWDDWWATVAPSLDETTVQQVVTGSVTPAALSSPQSIRPPCGTDDVWTPIATAGSPGPRSGHSAVWTGSHMIVWGGGDLDALASGGRYDPATDTWTPTAMANAPSSRFGAHAVWTGDEMLVWGGTNDYSDGLVSGGRYDPSTDRWTALSTLNAPAERLYDAAVWTGRHLIVWGGWSPTTDFTLNSGARYDPLSDSWSPTSVAGAPEPRQTSLVWTGSRMIVWAGACYTAPSGCFNTFYKNGALYDPVTDTWQPMTTTGAPNTRVGNVAVWTGSVMTIWGGSGPLYWQRAGQYDPAANVWLLDGATSGEPTPRDAFAVWTGSRMVAWGGQAGINFLNTGGRYDPATHTWTSMTTTGAPSPRGDHTMVWTGREVIVYGGLSGAGTRPDPGYAYAIDTGSDDDGDGFRGTCDCDDHDASIHPGAAETCNGRDDNCDGAVDDGNPGAGQSCGTSSVGECRLGTTACSGGSLSCAGAVDPAPETCDGRDNDCDGMVPSAETDRDGDGYRVCQGDCSDQDPSVHPGAVELPGNTTDENCDGALACGPTAAYVKHSEFVRCVSDDCRRLVEAGLISQAQCNSLISQAAQSNVGRKQRVRSIRVPVP